ncbi:MAG: hypothetical protein AAGF94_08285 [Pseudomonadota bacterium]
MSRPASDARISCRSLLVAFASASALVTLGAMILLAQGTSVATAADLVRVNAQITTMDPAQPEATALAAKNGVFMAMGVRADVEGLIGPFTKVIDGNGERGYPGLIDSHTNSILGGVISDLELRWDNVDSLEEALHLRAFRQIGRQRASSSALPKASQSLSSKKSACRRWPSSTAWPRTTRAWAAYDHEIFKRARPENDSDAEDIQEPVMTVFGEAGRSFYQNVTRGGRLLPVYENVARGAGLTPGSFIDHLETVSERNLERIAKLGCGVGFQNRVQFQAEEYAAHYGLEALGMTPNFRTIRDLGVPASGDTDAGRKGAVLPGQLADFAMLYRDYFAGADAKITRLRSVPTVLCGEVVHGDKAYADKDLRHIPPVSPDWSPAITFG